MMPSNELLPQLISFPSLFPFSNFLDGNHLAGTLLEGACIVQVAFTDLHSFQNCHFLQKYK